MTPSLLKTECFTAGDSHPHADELQLGANLELSFMENTANRIIVDGSFNRLVIEGSLMENTGPYSEVYIYRGHLAQQKPIANAPDEGHELVLPVIIKVSRNEPAFSSQQLVAEARFYVAHLEAAVSRAIVPVCYGVFSTGHTEDDDGGLTCLVLEDCDDNLTSEWNTLRKTGGLEFKHQLMKTVWNLHKLGVTHGNLSPHHITRHELRRTPCIIDFSRAKAGMQCSCQNKTVDTLREIVVEPQREEFSCDELWNFCKSLEVWAPRKFMCFGANFSVAWSQDDLEEVALQKPTFTDWDDALRQVYKTANEFLKKWYPGTPDDRRIQSAIDGGELDTLCAEYKKKMEANPPPEE